MLESSFFLGFIEYKDIFKKTHTSRFCMRIYPAAEKWKDGPTSICR